MKPLRLAAIGAGAVFDRYREAAAQIPSLELVAIVDPDPKRRDRAEAAGLAAFASIAHMLATSPDGALVLTPNAAHANVVQECLGALPTLCEKPLATRVRDAEALHALAAETGGRLYPAMHCRHRPEVRFFMNHADGPVVWFEQVYREDWGAASNWYYDPTLAGGGVLLDVGINQIDWLIRSLPGIEPRAARAELAPSGVDVECTVEWTFERGSGSTHVSWISTTPCKLTRIRTAPGTIYELDHAGHSARVGSVLHGPWRNDEYLRVLEDFTTADRSQCLRHTAQAVRVLSLLRAAYALADLDFLD